MRPPDVHLVIAGPDFDNLRPVLEAQVKEQKIEGTVSFTGMLTGDMKWSALSAASLFVLPSYSEGFSVAVLEALACGVPVIVTAECHIPEVASEKCGWVIPVAVAPLEEALAQFLKLPAKDLEQMGENGRALVHARFDSSVVGTQLSQVYDWLQGGSKPANVEIV